MREHIFLFTHTQLLFGDMMNTGRRTNMTNTGRRTNRRSAEEESCRQPQMELLLHDLQSVIREKDQEIDRLRRTFIDMFEVRQRDSKDKEVLNEQNTHVTKELARRVTNLEAAVERQHQLRESQHKEVLLNEQNEELRAQRSSLTQTVSDLQRRLEEMEGNYRDSQRVIAEKDAAIDLQKQNHAEVLTEIERQLRESQHKEVLLYEMNTNVTQQLSRLASLRAEQNQEITNLEAAAEAHRIKSEQDDLRIENMAEVITEKATGIATLLEEGREVDQRLREAEEKCQDLTVSYERVGLHLGIAEKQLGDSYRKCKKLTEEKKSLSAQLDSMRVEKQQTIDSLHLLRTHQDNTIDGLRKDKIKLFTEVTILRHRVSSDLEPRLEEVEGNYKKVTEEKQSLSAQLDSMRVKKQQAEETINSLRLLRTY